MIYNNDKKKGSRMDFIRKARPEDLARIAEIQIFNFRLYFYPIFLDDGYYFGELQVPALMKHYESLLDQLLVYDDGVVKGFAHIAGTELKKLYVEPILHGSSIGAKLLGEPAFDYEFGSIDLPVMVDMWRLPDRYHRHFFPNITFPED